MAGRSVWSDLTVAELSKHFVCVADEVWRLKRKEDAEGDFFRRFCELGHYRGGEDGNDTRQGIYVVTPSGELLGSLNSRDPVAVTAMLRETLQKWESASSKRSSVGGVVERLESKYPEDGLVLKIYTRDLPRDHQEDNWQGHAWNQDFAWFTKSEAIALANPVGSPGTELEFAL